MGIGPKPFRLVPGLNCHDPGEKTIHKKETILSDPEVQTVDKATGSTEGHGLRYYQLNLHFLCIDLQQR